MRVAVRSGGFLLRSKSRPSAYGAFEAVVFAHEPRVEFPDWPEPGQRSVFDRGDVRVETDDGEVVAERRDARASFHGLLTVRWDGLRLLYFAGYALWGYLTQPFLFAMPGFACREIEPWEERAETWRRLAVTFPADVPAHSREQVFYFDRDLRLRRNDYTAEVAGSWGHGAHYTDQHRESGGLLFATRRRVYPRVRRTNRPLPFPTLVWLDFDSVEPVLSG